MDSTAFNYNLTACYDDGTCIAVVEGCTDPTAFNFDLDLDANTDDGSCIPVIEGCTDVQAYNYDELVNTDDDSCLYEGCTDNLYFEYYNQGFVANLNDGSCQTLAVFGCILEQFANYNPDANVDANQDPNATTETCYHVFGCTDLIACNYESTASLDDNTCFYLEDLAINSGGIFYNCDGSCIDDLDGDGICDDLEISGCSDVDACNYEKLCHIKYLVF